MLQSDTPTRGRGEGAAPTFLSGHVAEPDPHTPILRYSNLRYPLFMDDKGSPLRKLGLYMSLVYTFPTAIILPALLGWWLDNKFGTKPWLVMIGFLLGLAAGFTYLFKSLSVFGKAK